MEQTKVRIDMDSTTQYRIMIHVIGQHGLTDLPCTVGHDDAVTECYISGNVTNSTACTDGYVNGWKHWCTHNAKECSQVVVANVLPGSLITDRPH
jgi:hypothetical protein